MRLFTGAFKLMDTHGVPLAVQLNLGCERGFAVSIPHFYRDALLAGWKPATATTRIKEAMGDAGAAPAYVEAALEWLSKHRELPEES